MKVYFDTCTLQRPLDDRSQTRILLEADAIVALLGLCEKGTLQLITSEVVEYEIRNNPNQQKRTLAEKITQQATERITLSDEIEKLAQKYEQFGMKAIDALHLASAETGGVDYFCTCDDRLYRRAIQVPDLTVNVRMPLELAQEVIQ
jgi:predicted nucleic acid-binding protein